MHVAESAHCQIKPHQKVIKAFKFTNLTSLTFDNFKLLQDELLAIKPLTDKCESLQELELIKIAFTLQIVLANLKALDYCLVDLEADIFGKDTSKFNLFVDCVEETAEMLLCWPRKAEEPERNRLLREL